jgi:hypothetical protein
MRTIWKYEIAIKSEQTLKVPCGSKALHVAQDSSGSECIWFEVETGNEEYERKVFVVGTGCKVPTEAVTHIGSLIRGWLVWHIYC